MLKLTKLTEKEYKAGMIILAVFLVIISVACLMMAAKINLLKEQRAESQDLTEELGSEMILIDCIGTTKNYQRIADKYQVLHNSLDENPVLYD